MTTEIENEQLTQTNISAINPLIELSNILVPDFKTRLLLTKPPIHQLEAGLNPLVDAAAYLFSTAAELSCMRMHDDLAELHQSLVKQLNDFEVSIQSLHYSPLQLAEFLPVTTYLLCTTLDDIISNTTWGSQKWQAYHLLKLYNKKTLPRESLIIILERYINDAENYIDIIEFIYLCFNLGFKYQNHSSGFSAEQLQKITQALYKRIYAMRGGYCKQLSINLNYPRQVRYFARSWQKACFELFKKLSGNVSENSNTLKMDAIIYKRFKKFKRIGEKKIEIKGQSISLSLLPWTICLGLSQSGKTSFIKNANIKYINRTNCDYHENEIKEWDYWMTPTSVIIDVPSHYLRINPDKSKSPWHSLLNLFLRERGINALNSVNVFLSYTDIMDVKNRKKIVNDLTQRIRDLQNKFHAALPFQIVITKCDLIEGFSQFFKDYNQQDIAQIWGANLPTSTIIPVLLHSFSNRFNQLIKQLNKQVIYHLQQEKEFDVYNKFLIKGFPIAVQRFKNEFHNFLKDMLTENIFTLKGFYLTSSMQNETHHKEKNLPQIFFNNEFLQSLNLMEAPPLINKSYFTKNLILHGLTVN